MKAGRTARPARPRSSMLSYLPVCPIQMRSRMPRRRSEEDAEALYRKEKQLGQPGLLDAWLAARLSQNQSQSLSMGAERQGGDGSDEVHCMIQVQCIKVSLGN